MKKPSRKRRQIWARLSKRRGEIRARRRDKKRALIAAWERASAARVMAPRYFLLERQDTHFELVKFLERLKRKLVGSAPAVLLDFRNTQLIFPGGGLLFYSEIQRIKDLFPATKFYCQESKSDRVNQVLQHLGIFKMLGHNSTVEPRRPDVVSWRHARSDEVDCTGAGQIIEAYDSLSKPTTKLLFKAASEAVTNAVMHAYSGPRKDGLAEPTTKNWWMFCREDDNKFYMAVCDLGVGIPRTLTVKNAPEVIEKILESLSFGARPSDAQMILGAMEYARTRTRLPQQGKGLMDLRRIIEEQGAGRLYVFSNRGCISYDPVNGYRATGFRKSIRGTIIVWSLPLSDGQS